jgi:hypothetical protein
MADKDRKQSRRERAKQRRKSQRNRNILMWGGIAVLLIGGLIGYNYWVASQPQAGERVEVMPSAEHINPGTLVDYNTSPPTSGDHYSQPLPAGFYDETSPEATTLTFPEGHIVHSQEHGYVVFWYNCENYAGDCESLKSTIRSVMEQSPHELIAFPWADMQAPLVMTAWGKMLAFETLDSALMAQFVADQRNSPDSPEPWAD